MFRHIRPRGVNVLVALLIGIFVPFFVTKLLLTHSNQFAASQGSSLSPIEAGKLEQQLTQHPEDLTIRSQLLGYYMFHASDTPAQNARQKHIFWIITHHPEAEIAGSPEAKIEPEDQGYEEAKRLWLKQVEAHPKSAIVLGNAASFFIRADEGLSERLLNRAQALAPNDPQWANRLGQLYNLKMGSLSGKERQQMAQQALTQFEKSSRLNGDKDNDLDDLAMVAFEAGALDKAREYATRLMRIGATPFSNNGNAIHKGNLILGRLALKAGDVANAKKYLLASGKTPGSPQLDSFGPNMILAKELLEKGEREVVLQYFQECSVFWESDMQYGRLKQWTDEVKAGKVPEFGANLRY